tara:strand:- start:395 stop:1102 length:708 start_codon:yes stop_codon:yes gene_type:complete
MTKVHLLGKAGDKFGKEFNLKAKDARELLRGIAVQRKGFYNYFIEEANKGVEYAFKRGDEFMEVNEAELSLGKDDIFIVPIAQGSISDSFKKDLGGVLTIIGVILLIMSGAGAFAAEGAILTSAQAAGIGTLLTVVGGYIMFDGIMGLLTDDSPANQDEGAVFGGPVTTIKSGVPIPLAYGKLQVSGTPINFGFTTRRIKRMTGWVNINNPDQEGAGDIGGGGGGDGSTPNTELK